MATVELFANQATTTVSSGGTDAPAPGTSQSWTVASSLLFPAASNSATPPTQFHVCDTASGAISEIIAVTNVSGPTWTVTRGAESTTPVAHAAGFTIQQVTTAGFLGNPALPAFAPAGLAGSVQASRYAGATASGHPVSGTYAVGDFTVDQTGSFWICTSAGTPGTWIQVVAGSVVGGVPSLDSTASDFQPDGVQAAGSLSLAARPDHVHPEKGYQSALLMPSGALAETVPRFMATGSKTSSSGQPLMSAIPLPKGLVVTNLVFVVSGAAETGGTHAWVALQDSTGKVLAVSADQTGATYFSPSGAAVSTALGTPYTVPSAGLYYATVCVTSSGAPSFVAYSQAGDQHALSLSPVLCGAFSGTQNAPPAVNATLAITEVTTDYLYAYVT